MLAAKGDVDALPALLERTNDWVPEVRKAAVEAVVGLLSPANTVAFVRCLPELDRIKGRRRANHASLVTQIEDFLVQLENREKLLSALQDEQPLVRHACLRLCASRGLLENADLVRRALGGSDVWARRLAARKLHDLAPEALQELPAPSRSEIHTCRSAERRFASS